MSQIIAPLVVGNWKMNGLQASLGEVWKLADRIAAGGPPPAEVVLCPPATLIHSMRNIAGDAGIRLGAQDCAPQAAGPYTGDISAPMLADAGASLVIVGHSERRAGHAEDDELVRRKATAALAAGLTPVVCVGETWAQRQAGEAASVTAVQLAASMPDLMPGQDLAVAYEPVWSIGSGVTPTMEDISAMHKSLRSQLLGRLGPRGEQIRLLYGGSLKPSNASDILSLPDVNGGLVGGASLLADDLAAIIWAA